jgi:hypothetical protein
MSYYKYKPRDPQVQVNWTEAASNLTAVIQDEVTLRKEKKSAIDEATREYQNQLNNQPQGESTSIREWGLKFGDQAQKQMMMQEQLLKSGMLNPNDYTLMRQNLVDGTDQAFSLMEHYQEVYANKMERMNSQDIATSSQALEVWMMENAEGFANFNNSQLAINPETGKVTAAMMRTNSETGERELTKDPNQFVAVSALQGQILTEYDKFDVGAVSSKFVEETGAWTTIEKLTGSRLEAGQLLTSIDPTSKTLTEVDRAALAKAYPGEDMAGIIDIYLSAENAAIDGIFGNPYNLTSVLTENVVMADNGKNYTFTYDEAEANANPEMILMERQGERNVPVFDESRNQHAAEQEKAIRSFMRVDIRNKINKEEKAVSVKDYTPPTYAPNYTEPKDVRDEKRRLKEGKGLQSLWNSMFGASAEERKGIVQNIMSNPLARSKGLIALIPSDDGSSIEFIFNNDTPPRTVDISGATGESWAQLGIELTDLTLEDAGVAGGTYNPDFTGVGADRNLWQKYNVEIDNMFQADLGQMNYTNEEDEGFLGQKEGLVADKLNELYGKYGLVAKPSNNAIDNEVILTMSGYNGTTEFPSTKSFSTNIYTNVNQDKKLVELQKWIKAALTSTNRVGMLAKDKGFSGKKELTPPPAAQYGPCTDGKKALLDAQGEATATLISC